MFSILRLSSIRCCCRTIWHQENYQKSPIFHKFWNCTLIQREDSPISVAPFWSWNERQFDVVRIYLELWRVECVSCGLVCEIFCRLWTDSYPALPNLPTPNAKWGKGRKTHSQMAIILSSIMWILSNIVKWNQTNIARDTTLLPHVFYYLGRKAIKISVKSCAFCPNRPTPPPTFSPL